MLITAMTGGGYGACSMVALAGYQPPCRQDEGRRPRPKKRQKQTRLTYGQYTRRPRLHVHVYAKGGTAPHPLRVWLRRLAISDNMRLNLRVWHKSAQTPPLRARIRVIAPHVRQDIRLAIKVLHAASRMARHRIRVWRQGRHTT